MYESIISKIHSAQTVGLYMHINPDADAIGSCLAMYHYLKNMGKDPAIFLEEGNAPRDNLSFLPAIDVINKTDIKHFDLSIALDCGAPGRLGAGAYKQFLKADDFACVDHHKESVQFVDDIVLEPKSSATCQILYKIMAECDKNAIDYKVATCLYTGIAADSGMLSYQNASPESYYVMYELVKYDISPYMINRYLFKNVKKNVFNLTNRALSNARFFHNDEIALITFENADFQATDTVQADTEGIINRIIDIEGVKVAITVAENSDSAYKVSLRSKDKMDCSKIAAAFGGGGHINASGCKLFDTLENVIDKLLKVTTQVLDEFNAND